MPMGFRSNSLFEGNVMAITEYVSRFHTMYQILTIQNLLHVHILHMVMVCHFLK